jgi:adenylate cyclase
MGEEQVQRRLAAIMVADVVGYSRLMGANEVATLSALKLHRKEVVDDRIAEHRGRIVKLTGDGMLVEFASVVSAVSCATEIQRTMRERNADVPEHRRIEFRMGINLGDVIVEDDDVYGDGVNIAARIEAVARPGGIAVSGSVRDNVGNRLDVGFEDAGEQTLKNIAEPVRLYHVDFADGSTRIPPADRSPARRASTDKPSVAILPFVNMSNDAEQEYFSDGITEDLITDLSNVSGLFVLGRHTVFAYKGKSADPGQIAKGLGVAYLVEGSVRKAGQKVRVNAQLVQGATGGHIWAERYDRDLTDIFAIQDEITRAIVAQLKVKLLPEERKAIEQAPTDSIEAYTHFLKGREFRHRALKANLLSAKEMFTKATELDPQFARAFVGIAICDTRLRSISDPSISFDDILKTAGRALEIDPSLAEAHAARGFALMAADRRGEAFAAFQRALALDPNCHEANSFYGEFCVTYGDLEAAVKHYTRALEINPDDYQSVSQLATILSSLGHRSESERYARLTIKRTEQALSRFPEDSLPAQLTAIALAILGERDNALHWLERALTIDPDDVIASYNAACTYARLGETDRAIDRLAYSLEKDTTNAFKRWFRNDPDLDAIRTDPRYLELVEGADAGKA